MSTLAIAPEAPMSNRTRRQQSPASPRRTPARRRMQWTPMASVAAAVLVVLASVGIWRINTMPDESLPPLAPQVAGITSGDDVALVSATPEATAVEDESSAVSIPIVQHVDEQPFDGPVIWLTTAGEVMYDNGSGEVTTIATGALQVMPQTTNVVKVTKDDPSKDWTDKDGTEYEGHTTTYHHLLNGKTLVDDGSFSSYLGGPNTFGPLTVLTIADAPKEWSIVNFDTMESKSISELTGGQYRSSDSITIAVSEDFSTIAIGTSQYESEASANLMKPSGMPGEVAVISSDLTDTMWVSVPDGMPAVGNISLSPDGSKIALISDDRSVDGSSMTVSVVDTSTNEELLRTEQIDSYPFSNFQWVSNGDAFVVISANSVQRFPIDGSDPTTLLESDGSIRQMPRMFNSELIYLEVSSVDPGVSTPEPTTTELVILNATTGETIHVQGDPWDKGMSLPVTIATNLAPIPVSQDGLTADLVHPLTGEVLSDVVANVDDPMLRPDFEPVEGQAYNRFVPVQTAFGAPVSAVLLADGSMAIITISEDSFVTRAVERPEGSEDMQINLSSDGRYLVIGNSWSIEDSDPVWVLDLSNENAEWKQFDASTPVYFTDATSD